jgi:ABC-type dipeptide/oligopeptide/nickel transport system ATPase component
VEYNTDHGIVQAVRGVTYKVHANEMLAIVGESGCGKSQSSYATMGLIQEPGKVSQGEILFYDNDGAVPFNLLSVDKNSKEMRSIRGGKMSMIFQEPMTALSPVHKIGKQIDEALKQKSRVRREYLNIGHYEPAPTAANYFARQSRKVTRHKSGQYNKQFPRA